jgi:hypothetical protein
VAKPIDSVGEFVKRVSALRKSWNLPKREELWFRGESEDYGETILRPKLYRPVSGMPLKPIPKLLDIENDLRDEFQRNAVELSDTKSSDEDWNWDSYFLMQHHGAPTRLLDWSDGSLMALHFALRDNANDSHDARVYVLQPYRLMDKLNALPSTKSFDKKWKRYARRHPSENLDEDDPAEAYLPVEKKIRNKMNVPGAPVVLEFPHITRRIAAQRSRFVVFGTKPNWLSKEFKKANSAIKEIVISARSRSKMRQELRDCGVTESVIYPDLDGLGRELDQLWDDRRAP